MKTPGTTTIAESHGWGVSPPFLLLQFSDSTLQNSHLASRLCSCGPRSAQLRSPLATALPPALPQNAADTRQSFGNGVGGGRWDSQHLGRSQARSLRTVHASPGLRAQLRLCRLPRHLFSFFSISKFLHSRTHLGYSIFLLFNFEEPGTPFASHAAGSPHCSQRAHRFISL